MNWYFCGFVLVSVIYLILNAIFLTLYVLMPIIRQLKATYKKYLFPFISMVYAVSVVVLNGVSGYFILINAQYEELTCSRIDDVCEYNIKQIYRQSLQTKDAFPIKNISGFGREGNTLLLKYNNGQQKAYPLKAENFAELKKQYKDFRAFIDNPVRLKYSNNRTNDNHSFYVYMFLGCCLLMFASVIAYPLVLHMKNKYKGVKRNFEVNNTIDESLNSKLNLTDNNESAKGRGNLKKKDAATPVVKDVPMSTSIKSAGKRKRSTPKYKIVELPKD